MDVPLRTPLYDTHVELGARLVDFAGWSLPIQYRSIKEEHLHTRLACSLFDVSHMGRLKVTGRDADTLLDRICTRKLSEAEIGRSYYSHICREDGGVLDDVIVSRFEEHWGIVCNASNRDKITTWITKHAEGMAVELKDETEATAMIALQGPKSMDVVRELAGTELDAVKRYRFKTFEVMGLSITAYRSGYTGEDGFEVVVPAGIVKLLIPRLLGTKDRPHPIVRPAGLGARDTLRIEAGMPLYGHELSENIDSLTAGQGWSVDLTKDFVGVDAMRELDRAGLPRKLVGLELDSRRIARQHSTVFFGDREIGVVTSGTLSPTLGKSIAMAVVSSEHAEPGSSLEVSVSAKRVAASVVKLPFHKRAG